MSEFHNSQHTETQTQSRVYDRSHLYSAPPQVEQYAQIPRRIPQTTLALQMGLSRDMGTSPQSFVPQVDYNYTSPFDYQSYLQRTRAAPERVQRPQFRSKVIINVI